MGDFCRKIFYCCGSRLPLQLLAGALGEMLDMDADFASSLLGRSKVDYDNVLADSEREAVADLLNYLENVRDDPMSWRNPRRGRCRIC